MRIERLFGLFFLLMTIGWGVGCENSQNDLMSKFTGMWRLDKYESFDPASGRWVPTPNRIGYSGYILYDGQGHMGVQLLPPGFKEVANSKPIDSLSNEELKKSIHYYAASFDYFANCKINPADSSIEHDRVSSNNPNEWGVPVTRHFDFAGDTLILTAKETIGGLKARLRWVKW